MQAHQRHQQGHVDLLATIVIKQAQHEDHAQHGSQASKHPARLTPATQARIAAAVHLTLAIEGMQGRQPGGHRERLPLFLLLLGKTPITAMQERVVLIHIAAILVVKIQQQG